MSSVAAEFDPILAEGELGPDALQEIDRCALCGAEEQTPRFEEHPFRVVECARCGLVYVTPRLKPELLHRVYAEDYWVSDCPSRRGYSDYAADAELYLRTFRGRLDFLERFIGGPGAALDVGCAAGFFIRVLRERGWTAHGVEPSGAIAEHARRAVGVDEVHVGDLESSPWKAGSYDLVSLWDVVEHVPDPRRLLDEAASMLRPGGHLVLETQNVNSAFARLLGPRWHHYKHLEHLYHFNRRTLRTLLEGAGLRQIACTWRYAGKHVSLAFVRERASRLHPLASRALRPLTGLDQRSLYVNVGDELIVVAQRVPDRGDG